MNQIDVTVRPGTPFHSDPPHWLAIVTIRGRSWYAIYASDKPPTEDKVRADWRSDGGARSKNWSPYYS